MAPLPRSGQVVFRFGKNYFTADLKAPKHQFIKVLQDGIMGVLKNKFVEVTGPKLKDVARKMQATGTLEFQQLAPYVTQHLIGIPNTPGSTTVLQFPKGAAGNRIFDYIVPSAESSRLGSVRASGDSIIWYALRKKYWQRKGQKGFFDNKGELRQVLAEVLKDVPTKVGDIKVTFDPRTLRNADLDQYGRVRDNKVLLGFFRFKYVRSAFVKLIPALRFGDLTRTDSSFGLEKALFHPRTVEKLGAELPKQRPMIQPVLGWFLLERIPAAMSRVAAEVLR